MKKIALLACTVAVAILTACSEKKETKKAEKYPVITPLVMDTLSTVGYVADIQSLQHVEIRTRIKGYIEKLHVDEGQAVKAGQLLFSINSKEYQQQLIKAKSALKNAMAELRSSEIELENTQKLADKNIVSKPELDMIKAKVDAMKAKVEEAEAEVSQASLNLSFTSIRAPFDGIINRIPNKIGSLEEEGALLTTISNNKEMYAYFNVSETDYLHYASTKHNDKSKIVSLLLADNTPYEHQGKIETVDSEIDKTTGNIAFRAKFPNPKQLLKHGSSGKVLVKSDLKNAMIIPQKATFEIQDKMYVFVVDEKNNVRMRKITTKLRLDYLFVLESGLEATDKILFEGIQLVKDGETIVPELIQSSEMLKGIKK